MDMDDFQQRAKVTDQYPITGDKEDNKSFIVPLLGLAGEAGTLLSEYKKFLRDGSAHEHFAEEVREELGDLLWYVAIVADRFGLVLSDVAEQNLAKARSRWSKLHSDNMTPVEWLYDVDFNSNEQLPRRIEIEFGIESSKVVMKWEGGYLGDPLTDNSIEEDYYRFHDVMHLSFAANLGWSPVIRSLMRRKRSSDKQVDEVQDGGRAIVVEEGLVAIIFAYGNRHDFLNNTNIVDVSLLKTIKSVTEPFEVGNRSYYDWQKAIVQGFRAWEHLRGHDGGKVNCDLINRSLRIIPD